MPEMPSSPEPFRLRDIALVAYGPTLVVSVGHGAVMPVTALRASGPGHCRRWGAPSGRGSWSDRWSGPG